MKTRIIQTRFWEDQLVTSLDASSKLVFMYLLTNSFVGMTGVYECGDRRIRFDTGVTQEQLDVAKEQLADKIYSGKPGWIVIKNALKYNNYASSPRHVKAFMKERESLPSELQKFVPVFEDVEEYQPAYVAGKGNGKHRNIAEKILGKKLLTNQEVHHIDHDPQNNELENLVVLFAEDHRKIHSKKITLREIPSDRKIFLSEYYHSTTVVPKIQKPETLNNKREEGLGGDEEIMELRSGELEEVINDPFNFFDRRSSPARSNEFSESFLTWWNIYPKKVGKRDANRAWEKHVNTPDLEIHVIKDTEKRAKSKDWTKEDGRYVPNPATYLNGHRWEDEFGEVEKKGYTMADLRI